MKEKQLMQKEKLKFIEGVSNQKIQNAIFVK